MDIHVYMYVLIYIAQYIGISMSLTSHKPNTAKSPLHIFNTCLFCLLSHISPLELLFAMKILSRIQRATVFEIIICGVFFETAPFKSYGVKRKQETQYAN